MDYDDTRSWREGVPGAAELLERCKRASLGQHAQRAAWDLGALVRRVAREAPDVHRQLYEAVEVLLQLSRRLSPRPADRGDRAPRQGELS